MFKMLKVSLVSVSLALFAAQALADAQTAIKNTLTKILPSDAITSIHETPIPGIYEVLVGTELIYVSEDGRYMFDGRLIDLVNRKDLTKSSPRLAEAQKRQAEERVKTLDAVGDENMVVFAPKKYDHTITVFTDIDCGYCRKLHSQVGAFNDEGIRVRYMFYPRAGVGSPSYKKAVSVWCSDDRQSAMTRAKLGEPIESKQCKNPVKEHMKIGEEFGINGTPAIVLDDGELIPGYVSPKQLSAIFKAHRG